MAIFLFAQREGYKMIKKKRKNQEKKAKKN